MTTTRPFCCDDLFRMATTNLDPLTETYNLGFYLLYTSRWPGMCSMQEAAHGRICSYMIGKAEGRAREWHGHVSALTVAPEFRRLGLAKTLMAELERVSDKSCVRACGRAGAAARTPAAAQWASIGRAPLLKPPSHPTTHPLRSYNGYFVDLYVRTGNTVAVRMYTALGYTVFRRVLGYYGGEPAEDAMDMRKPLPRDPTGATCVPLKAPTRTTAIPA